MFTRLLTRLPLVLAACFLAMAVQKFTHGRRKPEPRPTAKPMHVEARPPVATRPRILLDAPAIARLKDSARRKSEPWKHVLYRCEEDVAKDIHSGYEAFDWSDAVAELTLCWRATGERKFADRAIFYLNALLDDRWLIGDKKGGDQVVCHDDGYPMRTFAVFSALGYDWLYDAPLMTPALREKIIAREKAWVAWYREKGYQRDHPIANYFCGYLAAETFAGLAVAGDAPVGDDWLNHARDHLLGGLLLPEYAADLKGGDWPEGWQYGELSAAEVALVVAALRTGTGVDLAPQLPWLHEVVTHHTHARLPGGSMYDNGDWQSHPAQPGLAALAALPLALDPAFPDAAAEARYLSRRGPQDWKGERLWLPLLADRPDAPERDPESRAPLSLYLPGTGLSLLRSAWSPSAVFTSFQCGPTLADHQHNDQGHFELWRGADGLIVDGGDYGSAATFNHNTLLVDDGGKHLNYPPNQGIFGWRMSTRRFFDDGTGVVAVGEFADAYLPQCIDEGCTDRSVRAAERTFVYVRPNIVVTDDRITVDEAGFGVSWAAHFTVEPKVEGPHVSAVVGGSRVDVVTVAPSGAHAVVRKEPTVKDEHPYRTNAVWGPMWRLEVQAPRDRTAHHLLHVAVAGAANDAPPTVRRIEGQGLQGAGIFSAASLDVLFADDENGGSTSLPDMRAGEVLVAGLSPGATYDVKFAVENGACVVRVARGAAGVPATAGGAVRVAMGNCYNSPPK